MIKIFLFICTIATSLSVLIFPYVFPILPSIPRLDFPRNVIFRNPNDFRPGDLVTLQSASVRNAYLSANSTNCTDVQNGDTCGEVNGSYGLTNSTTWQVIPSDVIGLYCLKVLNTSDVYLYMNTTGCTEVNQTCGNISLIKSEDGCSYDLDLQMYLRPVNYYRAVERAVWSGRMRLSWGFNKGPNFLTFDAQGCSNSSCGNVTLTRFDSNMVRTQMMESGPQAFLINSVGQ
jgi:hypothetical protein